MSRFVLCLFILLLTILSVYAQTEKKAFLIGAHSSIIFHKNTISLAPSFQIGYFFKKKLLCGLSNPPTNSKNSLDGVFFPPDGFIKNRGIVSPFVRYYLFDDASFQFFLQQSVDSYQFKTNIKDLESYSNKISIGTTFNIGLIFFVDPSTTLEFCYSRPLLSGNVSVLPIERLPYLKFGLNYMLKKNQLKD